MAQNNKQFLASLLGPDGGGGKKSEVKQGVGEAMLSLKVPGK